MCDDAVADISADPPPVCFQCVSLLAEISHLKLNVIKLAKLCSFPVSCICHHCRHNVLLLWDQDGRSRRFFDSDLRPHYCRSSAAATHTQRVEVTSHAATSRDTDRRAAPVTEDSACATTP